MGKRRVAPKLAVLTPIYRGSPIVKVAPGAQKNRRCCAYKQASEWGAAGGGAAARQGDKCGAGCGVAPYAPPGLSPWYDTTDIIVPQKTALLIQVDV